MKKAVFIIIVVLLFFFVVGTLTDTEEVITSSPQIDQVKEVDLYIDSLSFRKVYMKGDTIYVEVVWSGSATEEPVEFMPAYEWLENLKESFSNQFKNYKPNNSMELEFYKDDKKIADLSF
jgi:cbb3-type cytochrome oxidase cytochrome c subunit